MSNVEPNSSNHNHQVNYHNDDDNGKTERPWNDMISNMMSLLQTNLVSTTSLGHESVCKITFHNCTRRNIKIYWFDHNGETKDYGILRPGVSLNVNTYTGHIWSFRVAENTNDNDSSRPGIMKVIAVPEEYLNAHNLDTKSVRIIEKIIARNIRDNQSPIQSPLAKRSVEKLIPSLNQFPGYVYCCHESDHLASHQERRRNIYLLEPFLKLKDLSILALNDAHHKQKLSLGELVKNDIPKNIRLDCAQYLCTYSTLYQKFYSDIEP